MKSATVTFFPGSAPAVDRLFVSSAPLLLAKIMCKCITFYAVIMQ